MNKSVVFCGYGSLAIECLKVLIKNGYDIHFILTHKDSSSYTLTDFATENGIQYYYDDMRKNNMFDSNQISVEYIISINYRYILPKKFFENSKYAINIHGSLLPSYRGRTPHVWSIINGEEYSGVTCHLIDEGIDTGEIIEQVRVKIETSDTGYSLLKKFEEIYPSLLIDSLTKIEAGFVAIKQDSTKASYYGKRIPEMGYIDFYKNKSQIINFVRAQAYPYPGAYYFLNNGKKIIINTIENEYNTNIYIEKIAVITDIGNEYYVRCNDGILKIVDYKVI